MEEMDTQEGIETDRETVKRERGERAEVREEY